LADLQNNLKPPHAVLFFLITFFLQRWPCLGPYGSRISGHVSSEGRLFKRTAFHVLTPQKKKKKSFLIYQSSLFFFPLCGLAGWGILPPRRAVFFEITFFTMVAVFGAVWEPKKVDTLIIGRGTRKNDPQKKKKKSSFPYLPTLCFSSPLCRLAGWGGRLGN